MSRRSRFESHQLALGRRTGTRREYGRNLLSGNRCPAATQQQYFCILPVAVFGRSFWRTKPSSAL